MRIRRVRQHGFPQGHAAGVSKYAYEDQQGGPLVREVLHLYLHPRIGETSPKPVDGWG